MRSKNPPIQTLYDGPLQSHYGQCYVLVGESYDICENVRVGQSNGLLGAMFPTLLFLVIGHHTGEVHMRIESHPSEPALDPAWEEVVEATFTVPPRQPLTLCEWGGALQTFRLPAGDYRVRYCAKDFGVHDEECTEERELDPLTERYLLCCWKEAKRPDAILKATRPQAQYWHDVAQGKRN